MNTRLKKLLGCFLILLALIVVGGCDEGPMEKAGRAVDEAVEDTGEALEDAGEAIEDAVEDQKKKE